MHNAGRLGFVALLGSLFFSCNETPRQETPSPSEAAPWTPLDLNAKALYSQHQEELIVRDFFQDKREGVFVDVGCATPIIDSNTYYLEKNLDWSGIAIDALPEYAESWQKRRPKSRYFHYLVTDHSDTVDAFYRSELPGISSYQKPLTGPAGNPRSFEELQVPSITLTQLLDDAGITKVDYLSMDIEGAEPLALAGFDIERFQLELACIEAKPANREPIVSYFTEHGYERIDKYLEYDPANYYFAPTRRLH